MNSGGLAERIFNVRTVWSMALVIGASGAGLLALTLSIIGFTSYGHSTEGGRLPTFLRGVRVVDVQPIGVSADKMIGIPQSALIHDGGAARVWVLGTDGGLALRPVETGRCSGEFIETVRGLKLGDRVIARGVLFEARSTLNPGDGGMIRGVRLTDVRCDHGNAAAIGTFNVLVKSRPE